MIAVKNFVRDFMLHTFRDAQSVLRSREDAAASGTFCSLSAKRCCNYERVVSYTYAGRPLINVQGGLKNGITVSDCLHLQIARTSLNTT